MKYCKICGKQYAEEHHVVFRSQAKFMENVALNKIPLCSEHHRGNEGPHLNKKIDIKYKLELQKELFKLFTKTHYTEKEIREALDISETETRTLVKTLKLTAEGYDSTDIVIRCMGGKLYAN